MCHRGAGKLEKYSPHLATLTSRGGHFVVVVDVVVVVVLAASGQRLRDHGLQRSPSGDHHRRHPSEPKAFWEESNGAPGPPGVEGVLPQPASAEVSRPEKLTNSTKTIPLHPARALSAAAPAVDI